MKRIEASKKLKDEIQKRYNETCAVCRVEGRLVIDVAHLFEDATEKPPTADRLILLCKNCNGAQNSAKHNSMPPLTEVIDECLVESRAREAYRRGDFSRSYAAHRLAAYVFESKRQFTRSVENLVEALSALRPIRWGDLQTSTLLEISRLCSLYKIGTVQRWLALDRLSLVLFDYKEWVTSAAVGSVSKGMRIKISIDHRDPQMFEFDRASAFRRQSMIEACANKFEKRVTPKNVLSQLVDQAAGFKTSNMFDSFATNLDVAAKIAGELTGNKKLAHTFSQLALAHTAKITHRWVLQEHLWREAEYFASMNDRKKLKQHVVKALQVRSKYPVVLEPRLSVSGPIDQDPHLDLQRFNISMNELEDRGLVLKHLLYKCDLQLTEDEVGRIVKSVSAD